MWTCALDGRNLGCNLGSSYGCEFGISDGCELVTELGASDGCELGTADMVANLVLSLVHRTAANLEHQIGDAAAVELGLNLALMM